MRGVGDRAVIGILFVFSGCTAGIDVDASEGDDKSQASTGQEAPADATDTRPVAEIIAEQCACAGPWSNHGDYVSCVAHATNQMKAEGRISGKEKGELQSAAAKSECGRASVEKGCPGEMLPSQCGTWEGVELLASRAYATNANQCGKKKGSPKEHFTSVDGERCLCAAISFEIPATIAVRAGDAGSATAKLTFTDAAGGGFTTCFFRGEGTSRGICDEPSTPNELGQRFIFESCSDGAVAGDVRLSQYFLFSVDGSPLAGVTTADLRLGEPDVVGGVVQLEEFVTTDANIIGEALIIPRGVVPPFQDFTLVSNAEIAETSIIGDQEMFIVLGPSSNVNAVGINGAYLFNPSDPCVRLRKTYEPSWLVPFGLTPSDLRLYKIANPIEVLAGEAPTVIEATDIPIVDETNHTISACVSSLSWFFAGARLSRTTNLAPIAIDSRPFVPYGGTQVLSPFDNATYVNGVLKPCGDEDQFFPFEDIATTRVFVPEAGIDVRTGIVVSDSPSLRYVITASGTVVPFPGSFVLGPWGLDSLAIRDIGPSGAHPERAPAGFPVPGAPVYALVARIGAITNKYFQTGGSHDVIPRRGEQGHLILRVNDDTPGDGTGGFDVTITTQIRRARCSEHVDRNLMIAVWSSTGAFERSGTPNIILGPWREKVDRYAAFLSDKKPDVIILNEVSMEGGGASWGDLKPGEWLDYFVGAMERVTGDDFAAANSSAGFHCKLGNLDVGTGGDAIVYRKSRLDLLNTDERYGTTINSPDSFNETMGLLRSEHARVPPAFVIRPDKPSTTCNDIVGGYSQPTLVAASFEFPRGSGRFISVGAAHLDGNPDYELLHPFFARIHQELPGPAYPPFFGGDLNYNWGDWFTYTKWLQGSEVVSHDNQLRNWAFDLDDPRAERRAPVQCLLRNFKPAMSEDDFARGLLHIYSGKDVWGSALPASLVTNGDSLYDERAAFCGGYRFSADPAIYHYPCALGDHGAPWRRFHLASRMDGSAPRHVAAEDFIPSEMPNAADECQRWAFNDIARTCNYEEQTLAWCPSEPPFSVSARQPASC
ncbi:MAG: hypothetical protein IT381_17340 [Deltaproteobacteria bacterium]|nr:hypothetical protein [Deltaproteobacteria bacterium]